MNCSELFNLIFNQYLKSKISFLSYDNIYKKNILHIACIQDERTITSLILETLKAQNNLNAINDPNQNGKNNNNNKKRKRDELAITEELKVVKQQKTNNFNILVNDYEVQTYTHKRTPTTIFSLLNPENHSHLNIFDTATQNKTKNNIANLLNTSNVDVINTEITFDEVAVELVEAKEKFVASNRELTDKHSNDLAEKIALPNIVINNNSNFQILEHGGESNNSLLFFRQLKKVQTPGSIFEISKNRK